ncbi:MAG: hypothetical protein ACK4M9_12245 [Anaerobacillus sp.]|uniref:hypothetical protein n=1 Tax=Anaerobacillus sp. TaxID=1872506 RepID=UPI00391977CC
MTNKNMLLGAIFVIAFIIAIPVWVGSGSVKQLKDLDTADIAEITIASTEYYTITEPKDIETLLTVLQSMNLSRRLPHSKDGFVFLIDIKLKSGETIGMSILSDDIIINNHNYKPDKNYSDSIREVFDKLAEKYENNPS